MMTSTPIPVRLLDRRAGLTGRSSFSEYHLQYTRSRPSRWLPHLSATWAQVGDLSRLIDPLDCSFQGLDFYTHPAHWQSTSERVPESSKHATLLFTGCLAADGVLFYDGEPAVESTANGPWLRIVLAAAPADLHVVCADGVLAGIAGDGADGHLVDLWLAMLPGE